MVKRALQLELSKKVWKIIDTQFKLNDESDSEIIAKIVKNHLAQNGYYPDADSLMHGHGIKDFIDIHQAMIDSIIELLESKGLATYQEWGKIMDKKVMKE